VPPARNVPRGLVAGRPNNLSVTLTTVKLSVRVARRDVPAMCDYEIHDDADIIPDSVLQFAV
jgi:hypothetical protein